MNFAEISEADNVLGQPDIDSTPDGDDTNDAGGNPDTASDDVVGGDGSGMPGDEDAGTDEDDHDPASITIGQVFDLALTKELSSAGPFAAGDTVTFTITVINQGTLDATDIEISDYVPAGMTLADGDWNADGTFDLGDLDAGAMTTVDVDLEIDADFQGTELVNFAEISSADNALGQPDVDSTPDGDDTNDAGGNPDTASDDVVGGDGSGTPGDEDAGTDEDDHDPASVTIGQVFDLALTKELSSAGPFAAGDTVTFTITVINQGTLDATDIELSLIHISEPTRPY